MKNILKELEIDEELFKKFSDEMKKHDLDCSENELIALYLVSKAQIDAEHELFFKGGEGIQLSDEDVKGLW